MTADDIMHRDVVTVSLGDTLQDAMNQMTENHVTGLPVMDRKSRCVGLISATDILNYEQEHTEFTAQANSDMARHFNMDTQRWESVRVTSFALEEFGEVRVDDVMARDLVSVARDTPVQVVAATMIKGGIHRVLVLDENQRLYGIISAFDFVQLIDEALK
jgi:CBS domain-containing protein